MRSPVPIVTLWGEGGVMIYNDAYSVFAAERHPRLLGSKVREGWPEVADFNDNVMKVGLAGGTLAYTGQELTLYRRGRPEQVWMNHDYSPLLGESGDPMEDLPRRTLGERIELERALAGGLWMMLCDPNRLENAILNLAINARDAMPDGKGGSR